MAALPRLLAALTLVDPDPDAYEYIETVASMRDHLASGAFSVRDLAGFWLPMYQFICACISLPFNHPFYVAKLFSVACGAGACVLVFLITMRLTERIRLALAAFALVALSPLQVMYSGYAMTEAPFAFMVAAALYLVVRKRWVMASIVAVAAGLIRVEAWVLIPLLPALAFFYSRRAALISAAVLAVGPLICFYIYWAATGDPLKYFHTRASYIKDVIDAQPELSSFSVLRVWLDLRRFMYAANPLLVIGCVAATFLLVKLWRSHSNADWREKALPVLSAGTFYLAFLVFLALAYLTNSQPQIWVRYGLLFSVLGAPLAMWAISKSQSSKKQKLIMAAAAICFILFAAQLADTERYAHSMLPQLVIAGQLRVEAESDPSIIVCCDDPQTRVLSKLPYTQFITSSDLPSDLDIESLIIELKKRNVHLFVVGSATGTPWARLLPQIDEPRYTQALQQVVSAGPNRAGVEFRLYQIN